MPSNAHLRCSFLPACGFAFCSATLFGLSVAAVAQPAAEQSGLQLETVVVTATGSEQIIQDAPASITVISREELEEKAFKDVTDAIRDVPGVVVTGGGSHSDISIRGMAPKYTMILVDGKRQNSRETRPNSDGPGIEQGWLPPVQAIERIEVIRGPMSSLYGSDAMGGVINIITRKVPAALTGSLRNEITLQEDADSGNHYQSSVYLAGPLIEDRLGLAVHGQARHRQEDHIINGFNEQDVTSGGIKLALTPNEAHDLVAKYSRTRQKRVATPGKSIPLFTNDRRNTVSDAEYDKESYSLTHTGRWGWATSDSYIQREKYDNPVRDMYLQNTQLNSKWNALLGAHMLTAGFDYLEEELRDQGNQFDPTVSRLERYQWALFAEDEWLLTEDFALTTGLRMTDDENYGSHWTPRLYGVWDVTEQLTLKGGVSTGFSAPTLRQSTANWGQITGGRADPTAIIMGNPDLEPEKSISQEIGLIWDNLDGRVLSLTLFNTRFKDKISEVRKCPEPGVEVIPGNLICPEGGELYKYVSTRVNVDRASMHGVEAALNWQLGPDLILETSYTYTHSEQKSGPYAGEPLNKMPKHMFNASLDWQASEALDFWSRVSFRGKTSDYLFRTDMEEGTPSFTFFDVGGNYKFNDHISTGLGIYNVFDKRVGYDSYGAVYDGRRYWAHLTIEF